MPMPSSLTVMTRSDTTTEAPRHTRLSGSEYLTALSSRFAIALDHLSSVTLDDRAGRGIFEHDCDASRVRRSPNAFDRVVEQHTQRNRFSAR